MTLKQSQTNVKIILGENETIEEAEETLFKALRAKRKHHSHSESYSDPAMKNVVNKMEKLHSEMINKVIKDIEKELK